MLRIRNHAAALQKGVIGTDESKFWVNIEGRQLNICDLLPGMSDVDIELKVLSVSEPKQIITGSGIEHEILEADVEDETGKIRLVLWDGRVIPLKVGDVVKVRNGFVSSFKGEWRINVGKSGEVEIA